MRIRRHTATVAVALSTFATAGPLNPDPAFGIEETGSIQGIVTAEDGGAPLPAALVVVDGTALSATTGADGAFVIDRVPAGAYRLTVTREAFAPLTSPVTVVAGQPVLLDLRLPVLQFEESVVVTATQTERAVTEVAASVTILDAETIKASSGPLSAQIRTSYRYSNQRLFQENFTLAPTRQTTIVDPPGPAVSESVSHGVFPFAALTGQDTGFRSVLVEPQLTWAPNLEHTVVLGASYTGERGSFGDSIIADRSNLLGSDATLARVAAGIRAGMAAGGVPNPTVTLVRDPAIGEAFPLSQGRREQFDIFSAYVQDEWVLADRLRLVPGLRYDQHSEFGSDCRTRI